MSINHGVFWPAFSLLTAAAVVSLIWPDWFENVTISANAWILNHFDQAFNLAAFAMVLLCIAVGFSPLGKVKIGGEKAVPMLSRWRWFSIVLC
ncbi:MAG: BCCT family transporter, partial [Flavobacteriales bacterium]|nr:BCCT family transporter [Flavobacteriales bacterium]